MNVRILGVKIFVMRTAALTNWRNKITLISIIADKY